MITVVGAGDIGEVDGMTVRGKRCIDEARVVVFQSSKQACYIEDSLSLDDIYEASFDFDNFTDKASDMLIAQGDDVVFVAIGDGISNNVVKKLASSTTVEIIAGHASISISTAAKLGLTSMDSISFISAYDFFSKELDTNYDTVICQIDSPMLFWDIKARLLDYYPGNMEVVINKAYVALEDADYLVPCDIFLPKLNILDKKRYSYFDLMTIVKELRQKCPWDREQNHRSILQNLLEESFELYDAIDNDDKESMLEEMGDVLLQICLHTLFEVEHGDVRDDEATTLIAEKLIRRHPHVYGEAVAENKSEVKASWDSIKRQEYNINSFSEELKHISTYLPATMRGSKVIKKMGKKGIELTGDIDKVISELKDSVNIEENSRKLSLLFVKLLVDNGLLPYIVMNDAVNSLIDQIALLEKNTHIVDKQYKIRVDDVAFIKKIKKVAINSKKS